MKNLKKVLISSIILTIFFLSGCANSLQSDDKLQNQFATLKVSSSDSKSRALDIDEIKFLSFSFRPLSKIIKQQRKRRDEHLRQY